MSTIKKNPYAIDPEFTKNETALLLLNTNYLNFEFILLLNKLYHLNLIRVDDVTVDDTAFGCYSFYDTKQELHWVMIDRPLSDPTHPVFANNEKMLLINGRDCWDMQEEIYQAVYGYWRKPQETEYLEMKRYELIQEFKDGIFSIEKVCLSPYKGVSLSSYPGPIEAQKPAIRRFMKHLQDYTDKLFEAIHWHLMIE